MEKKVWSRQYVSIVLFVLMIFFAGCTHYYVPKQYPVNAEAVPEIRGGGSLAIINGYESPYLMLIGMQGAHKWMGDMQQWTGTAAGLLKAELEKRKFRIIDGAPKTVKLKVVRAQIYWGFAAIRCILSLKAETGDGNTFEYEGNNASGWTLYRACDGAVTKAVTDLMKDPKIIAYLTE
ncbi:hypothetical protein ACFL2O_06390 [Thermodesulfobacteriota bacterium]